MKIQIISNITSKIESKHELIFSKISEPKTLASFDINIFNLQYENLWTCKEQTSNELDVTKDFYSIKNLLANSDVISIIAFPQNYLHRYHYATHSKDYYKKIALKDELYNLRKYLLNGILPFDICEKFDLLYENSKTELCGSVYDSSFCFLNNKGEILSKCCDAEKATTIAFKNIILTTLNLNGASLDDFIKGIGLEKENVEYPQWLLDFKCLDDEQQNLIVNTNNEIIENANNEIEKATEKLQENLKYKSILVTNGDELVSVVFNMLETMLSCDLSEFVDEKREDFLIKKDGFTYIGEIKGVTSNIKSEHISQLEVHYRSYLDKLDDEGVTEVVKPILIINPFRTKPISERDEVHEKQVQLSIRNGSLILTTETLLNIYEMFLKGETSTEKICTVFSNETGLADIDYFKCN